MTSQSTALGPLEPKISQTLTCYLNIKANLKLRWNFVTTETIKESMLL